MPPHTGVPKDCRQRSSADSAPNPSSGSNASRNTNTSSSPTTPATRKKLQSRVCGIFIKHSITEPFNNNNKNYKKKIMFTGLGSNGSVDPASIDTALSFLPSSPPLWIRDCGKGLLLLTHYDYSLSYVCNPATRNWAQISEPTHN